MTLKGIKPGDVFLLRTRGRWYSDAIAWFMGPDLGGLSWSHSGLVRAVSGELGPITLETSDFEVTYGSLAKYQAHPDRYHLRVYRLDLMTDPKMRRALLETDLALYGKIYGYLQLLSFGIRRLLKRVNLHISNFIRQGQVCTAVPLHFLRAAKHPYFRDVDPEALDTVEFADMLIWMEGRGRAKLVFESGRQG